MLHNAVKGSEALEAEMAVFIVGRKLRFAHYAEQLYISIVSRPILAIGINHRRTFNAADRHYDPPGISRRLPPLILVNDDLG